VSANLVLLAVIGILVASGVYLVLERSVTKMLIGLILIGNGVNLLILTVGGTDGAPPIVGRDSEVRDTMADPLAQAMILTAIVISMGIAAFVLSLIYRIYQLTTDEVIANDPEDTRVAQLTDEQLAALDEARPTPDVSRDTDDPDELDALPGLEGSR
jgi:multicomponent Na+:H+ antiporter subunit C